MTISNKADICAVLLIEPSIAPFLRRLQDVVSAAPMADANLFVQEESDGSSISAKNRNKQCNKSKCMLEKRKHKKTRTIACQRCRAVPVLVRPIS